MAGRFQSLAGFFKIDNLGHNGTYVVGVYCLCFDVLSLGFYFLRSGVRRERMKSYGGEKALVWVLLIERHKECLTGLEGFKAKLVQTSIFGMFFLVLAGGVGQGTIHFKEMPVSC